MYHVEFPDISLCDAASTAKNRKAIARDNDANSLSRPINAFLRISPFSDAEETLDMAWHVMPQTYDTFCTFDAISRKDILLQLFMPNELLSFLPGLCW